MRLPLQRDSPKSAAHTGKCRRRRVGNKMHVHSGIIYERWTPVAAVAAFIYLFMRRETVSHSVRANTD